MTKESGDVASGTETVTLSVTVSEAEILRMANEIRARRAARAPSVQPGLYRWKDRTDADPLDNGPFTLRRKDAGGSWSYAHAWGEWQPSHCSDEHVRSGSLVPLRPVEGMHYEGGDPGVVRRWTGDRWQETRRRNPHAWVDSVQGDYLWLNGLLRPVAEAVGIEEREQEQPG